MTDHPHQPPDGGEEEAVVAAVFATREEAEAAVEIFELAGIPAILRADDISGLVPSVMTGHEVLVPESQLDQAMKLLEGEALGEGEETDADD